MNLVGVSSGLDSLSDSKLDLDFRGSIGGLRGLKWELGTGV